MKVIAYRADNIGRLYRRSAASVTARLRMMRTKRSYTVEDVLGLMVLEANKYWPRIYLSLTATAGPDLIVRDRNPPRLLTIVTLGSELAHARDHLPTKVADSIRATAFNLIWQDKQATKFVEDILGTARSASDGRTAFHTAAVLFLAFTFDPAKGVVGHWDENRVLVLDGRLVLEVAGRLESCVGVFERLYEAGKLHLPNQ